MIYTLTVNPSLDYIVEVEDFRSGQLNRTVAETVRAGGKGLNVSIVLKNLGVESCALGFSAGFTGEQIVNELNTRSIQNDFVKLHAGFSRINTKITSVGSGKIVSETEINARGPVIALEERDELFSRLSMLKNGDTLVLSGSIPRSLPSSLYADVMDAVEAKGVRCVVDATGPLLAISLPHHPFLVKPNADELGEVFEVKVNSCEDAARYAFAMRDMGAQNVLVSLAGDGAVLAASDGKVYSGKAIPVELVHSVGAGDSMVAGFLAGLEEKMKWKDALRYGICAGTATVGSKGLAEKSTVQQLLNSYPEDFITQIAV